jgi:DNA-binding MurR/RpiR family transcriptional regulator
MDKSFEERINEATLTKTGKKIAEYFLSNKYAAAFHSLGMIAAQLNISDISIVRFARALGYSGFPEMKQMVQNEMFSTIDENPESVNSLTKFVANKDFNREDHLFVAQEALDVYTKIITRTLQANNHHVYDLAADHLIASNNKYIIGMQSRSTATEGLSNLLQVLIPKVIPISSGGYTSFLKMLNFTADDCIVLFSFGRLTKTEKNVLDMVKAAGAYLIVISDQRITPAAKAADLLIYSCSNTSHFFYSNVCNVMISEIIASSVASKTWETSRKRIESVDRYLNEQIVKG